jgi:hypothetical protein
LDPDPDKRYQDYDELIDDLHSAIEAAGA